jgi:hypothetical protein
MMTANRAIDFIAKSSSAEEISEVKLGTNSNQIVLIAGQNYQQMI